MSIDAVRAARKAARDWCAARQALTGETWQFVLEGRLRNTVLTLELSRGARYHRWVWTIRKPLLLTPGQRRQWLNAIAFEVMTTLETGADLLSVTMAVGDDGAWQTPKFVEAG